MKDNYDNCLKELLIHEGGFVNHPADPGGMTNLGVTKATYEDWIGYPVTEKIMRGLTISHVKTLYKTRYWNPVKADELPAGLDLCVFDFGVNAGVNRAARYVQRMVGAEQDGQIGPKTLSLVSQMVKSLGANHVVMKYQDMRRDYYRQLPTFSTFGKGWLRRVKEVEATAINMIPKGMRNV